MEASIAAVLPLAGVLVGAALQYAFGRSLEARKQLTLQRAQAYIDFFKAIAGLAQVSSKELLVLATDAKTRICIYGSEAVIQKLGIFERSGAKAATDVGRAALVEVMQAMRKDILGKGALPDQRDVEQNFAWPEFTRQPKL